MSVSLDELPATVRDACRRLRTGLIDVLGSELVALWVYGAVTFPDRPRRLGDVDTHGVLAGRPNRATASAIDEVHQVIARDCGVKWDSWYILESDARRADPPSHVLRADLEDEAWALHRAHWLAGRFVALHGRLPSELVPEPMWPELEDGLREELAYIDELRAEGRDDLGHCAFMVLNACRIICSLRGRNVVLSKRAAAKWALQHLPRPWHEAIRAGERFYDDKSEENDNRVLKSSLTEIVSATRDSFSKGTVS